MKFREAIKGVLSTNKLPSNEMIEHYNKRTQKHIQLVQKYGELIDKEFPEQFEDLIDCISVHDNSKLEEPEYTPYIWLTHQYKCKRLDKECKLPKGMQKQIYDMTLHHIKNNAHHPEFHSDTDGDILNKNNRDGIPNQIVDATKMDNTSIAEMVADWMAVGEEVGNTAKSWADKMVNKRWKFTKEQKDLIYEIIKKVE